MFKNYSGLWLLLATALAVIFVVAFSDDIVIGDYTIKKAPFDKTLFANESNRMSGDSLAMPSDTVVQVKAETDSLPQSLFIFGDSMTWNLALRLAQYAKANGHTIHSVNWDSSNTKIWADYDTLANQIARYKPTQIFISLGSNELYFKDPRSRLPYIKKILEVIDTIPYVWIGPLTGRRIPASTICCRLPVSREVSSGRKVCISTGRPITFILRANHRHCGLIP